MKFDICGFFKKSVEKSQVWLKSDKNDGVLCMKTYVHLWYYLAKLLQREMFQKKVVEKMEIHTFYVQ